MATDVTLGGQKFSVDNPNQIMGLLDNFMKLQMAQQLQGKQEAEKQSLLQTLQGYDLSPAGEAGPAKNFEELGSRYKGTSGERDESGNPIPIFEAPKSKPQVTNLRQLVDVIQGMKGLPPEYAGAIVSRLTGIPDQSQVQAENLTKLRATLQAPYHAETTRLKEEAATQKQKISEAALSQQKELTIKRLRATALNNIIKNSVNPKEKQSATDELMKLLLGGDTPGDNTTGAPAATPNFSVKWTTK